MAKKYNYDEYDEFETYEEVVDNEENDDYVDSYEKEFLEDYKEIYDDAEYEENNKNEYNGDTEEVEESEEDNTTSDDNIEDTDATNFDVQKELSSKKNNKKDSAVVEMIDNEIHSGPARFKDFNEIMDDYHSGDAKRIQQAKEDACVNLKGFIIYIITHNYWTYCKNNFYDMLQSGYMGVIKNLGKYNPKQTMPTTFFKTLIISEISRYITEFLNHSTVHYSSALHKVNDAIRYFEAKGIPYNEDVLAEYTGLSLVSVKGALASKEAAISVNFQDEYDNESDSVTSLTVREDNPEKYMEKQELAEAVLEALNDLPEMQKAIMMMHYGFSSKEMSLKEIADELGLTVPIVKNYHQQAIKNLQDSKLRLLFPDKYASEKWLSEEIDFFPDQDEDIVEFDMNDFFN